MTQTSNPLVVVLMGSKADWETMRHVDETLSRFDVPHECRVISAHRAPAALTEYVTAAEGRGVEVIIAGAGGAAHLAGVTAAQTLIPVLGVPMETSALHGMDSLLSTVQMPGGIPVGTLAIGRAGAVNAALLAASVLALGDTALAERLEAWRARQTAAVVEKPVDEGSR
jgi:5-(carboxyamino)imidazole ribonucleotide mutase